MSQWLPPVWPGPMDDIVLGTVCFAGAFTVQGQTSLFSLTHRFKGDRQQVIRQATWHALGELKRFHRQVLCR